jgi:hypothetical protein
MTTPEMVKVYVNQLCAEIGVNADSIYNAQTQAWYFTRGSANLEVFLNSYTTSQNKVRTFVRVFSPLCKLPTDQQTLFEISKGSLDANAQYMGIKIGSIAGKDYLYAIAERDIEGMDYKEFVTLISDLGYWADQLDDYLKQRFAASA